MKTRVNIRLNDELLGMARVKAESEGSSLTALIEQGLAMVLGLQAPQSQPSEQVHTPDVRTLSEEDIQEYVQPLIRKYIQQHVQPQLDEQATRLTQLINGARLQGSDHCLESIAITQGNLESLTRDEVRKIARRYGVKKPDNMRKSQLIDAIMSKDSH